LNSKSEALTSLLVTVQSSSEAEAAEIFRRIRQPGTDIQYVAEQIQAGQQLFGIGRRPSGRKYSISKLMPFVHCTHFP